MIAHLVLFRPRVDLDGGAREALTAAFISAVREIPSVRRARIGRRITHGRAYEALMQASYPYAVILEFEDLAGLRGYLEHPVHEQLATRFFEAFDDALMYDYELREGTDGALDLR